ncbi:MAG: Rieske 2Fe-2S domain-containing protein [Gammaproteobacteria bacterium]|nr:Rieske 2Fe-2S domain-containing protein [Gammaproteobacteria bacterium]
MANWKTACLTSDVAIDTLALFNVAGTCVLIANLGDEFKAYPPMCPHMEEPLVESGICADGILTCNKHLWQWDMRTGEIRAPAERPSLQILMYDVKVEGDSVLVDLEQELEYEFDEEEDDDDFHW